MNKSSCRELSNNQIEFGAAAVTHKTQPTNFPDVAESGWNTTHPNCFKTIKSATALNSPLSITSIMSKLL